MMEHKALWQHAVWPVVLNVVITLVLFFGIIWALVTFHGWYEPTWVTGWLGNIFEFFVGIVLALISIGVGLIAWLLLQAVLVGHFYGVLAAAAERRMGLGEDEIHEVPLRLGFIDALRDVRLMLLMLVAVTLLPFVPFVGLVLAPVVALYVETMVMGREFIDHPLSLRGARWTEKQKFVKRHRAHTLGFGAACLLLALTPLLGAVLLCPAVVGGVILHRRIALTDERAGWSWREPQTQ